MAERDIVRVIQIEAQPALKSLKDLKKEVEDAAISLAKLDKGTTEYDKAAADLADKQEQLNKAIGLAKTVNEPAANSYAALSKEMAALKKEWRETGDTMRRNELGQQINSINDRLKVLDKSIGDYHRLVGSYTTSVVDAFRQMGGAAGGELASGIKTANTAFKMLATNPIGAALTLLVPLIMKIVNGLKSSEENANAAAKAFSGFKVIGDLLTNALQTLGKGIAWVGEQFTKLLDKLHIDEERRKNRLALTEAEIELQERERKYLVENAKAEEEISELRAKAVDKQNYSAKERQEFLDIAIAKEKLILDNELDIAQRRLDIAREHQKLAQNSKEENDELAEAIANMSRVRQRYNESMRRLTSERNRTEVKDTKDTTKEIHDIEAEEFAERLKNLDKFNDEWEKKERKRHETEIEETRKAFEKLKIAVPAELQTIVDAQNNAYQTDVFNKELAERTKQQLEDASFNTAKASIDGLADLLESSGEQNEKAVAAAKGLRAASATMDALAAANSAYNAMAGIPVVGPALGIAAAAAALASGYANVRQILAVSTKGTSAVQAVTNTTSASSVQAPAIVREVAAQRTVTPNTQTQTLNKIATDTRVYVVESDIAQAGKRVNVRDSESTFK